ncbi:hypothetical protein MO973_38795 [Paenibacillus sp. TRM 82003]|nr:hypothetical protein [Kineococcus sp. TRM81007]MCI3926151.1 hypothetical protein [Paenibacillus sp. TRM 82003]
MTQGRIVEAGARDDVFDRPQDDYTTSLLRAVPRIPAEWDAERRERAAQRAAGTVGTR